MGNTHSDAVEKDVHNVVKWIPGVGQVYGGMRGIVYAAKGDKAEALNSLINTVPVAGPITTSVIDHIDATPSCTTREMTEDDDVWKDTIDEFTKWLVVCGPDDKDQWFNEQQESEMRKVEKYIDDRVKREVIDYNLSAPLTRPTVREFWDKVRELKKKHKYLGLYYTGHGSETGICLSKEREKGCCSKGHKLVSLGTSRDNGWKCDGKKCVKGCSAFGQTYGWNRHRCETCDYDLCDGCFKIERDTHDYIVDYNHLSPIFYRVVLSCCHGGGTKSGGVEHISRSLGHIPYLGAISLLVNGIIEEKPQHKTVKFYSACRRDQSSNTSAKGDPFNRYCIEDKENGEQLSWEEAKKLDYGIERQFMTVTWSKALG